MPSQPIKSAVVWYNKNVYLFVSGGLREERIPDWPWRYFYLAAFSIDETGKNLPRTEFKWSRGALIYFYPNHVSIDIDIAVKRLESVGFFVFELDQCVTKNRKACAHPAKDAENDLKCRNGHNPMALQSSDATNIVGEASSDSQSKIIAISRFAPKAEDTLGLFLIISAVLIGASMFSAISLRDPVLFAVFLSFAIFLPVFSEFKEIPASHRGVISIFGERTKPSVLNEGTQWLPPFMTVENVDMRARALHIPEFQAITLDNIPVKPDMTVSWKVYNPYLYLQAQEDVESVAFPQIVKAKIIEYISNLTLSYVVSAQGRSLSDIIPLINEQLIQWGIEIDKAISADVKIGENLIAEFERLAAADIIANQCEVFTRKLGVSPEDALRSVMILRGAFKSESKEFSISDKTLQHLVRLLNEIGKKI